MKVLVVSAHPDDEILGVGGTIRRHVLAGDEVHVFLMCGGVTVRYQEDDQPELEDQVFQAGDILGVTEVLFGKLPDQALDSLPIVDVISTVEEHLQSVRPDVVYTHFGGDVNRDHRLVFEAVQVATRPYAAPFLREVMVFETPSSTEWGHPAVQGGFLPQVFVDISTTLDDKIAAFCCYEKEVRPAPHPRSPWALEARARAWGSVAGLMAAEPFHVVRSIR